MKKFYYDLCFEAENEIEAELKAISLSNILPNAYAEKKQHGLKEGSTLMSEREKNFMRFMEKTETVAKILQHLSENPSGIEDIADLLGVEHEKKYFIYPPL